MFPTFLANSSYMNHYIPVNTYTCRKTIYISMECAGAIIVLEDVCIMVSPFLHENIFYRYTSVINELSHVVLACVPDGYFTEYSIVSPHQSCPRPFDHLHIYNCNSTSCPREYRMAIHQEIAHLNMSPCYMSLSKLQSLMPVRSSNSSGIYSAYVRELF